MCLCVSLYYFLRKTTYFDDCGSADAGMNFNLFRCTLAVIAFAPFGMDMGMACRFQAENYKVLPES